MDHRPRRGAGRSGLHRVLRRRRHPPARRPRWTRRSPPASTSIPRSRWRCRSTQGLAAAARGARRAGSSTARSRTSSTCRACRSSRGSRASDFFGRVIGFRIEFGWWVFDGTEVPCQRPSWNYRRKDGGGLILDMYPHWRYVIENTLGPIRRVVDRAVDRDARAHRRARRALRGRRRGQRRRRWSSWKAAPSARSSPPGRRGCAATTCSPSRSTAPRAPRIAGLHRCWTTTNAQTPRTAHFNIASDIGVDYRAHWQRGRRRRAVQEPLPHRLGEFPAPRRRRRADAGRLRRRHPRRAVRRSLLPQHEGGNMDQPRTALVTGTSAGLGRAIAVALAREGYDLALTELDTAHAEGHAGASRHRQAQGRCRSRSICARRRASRRPSSARPASSATSTCWSTTPAARW